MVTGLILPPKTDEQNAGSGIRGLATISHLTRPKRPPDHSNRNTVDRVTLPGGEWIRTFSSAQDSNSSCFRPSSADLPAHDHPSSCRPRRTDRVVGRGPESRHSPPGGGVTPRSRCRRCERIAEPKVRIRSSPPKSQRTFGPRAAELDPEVPIRPLGFLANPRVKLPLLSCRASGKVPETHSVDSICDHDFGVFTVTNIATENTDAVLPAHSLPRTPKAANQPSGHRRTRPRSASAPRW
jgi:hypothetical protein